MKPEEFKQATEEFKVLYQEEFKVKLSDKQASEKAKGLLQLFDCLIGGEDIK